MVSIYLHYHIARPNAERAGRASYTHRHERSRLLLGVRRVCAFIETSRREAGCGTEAIVALLQYQNKALCGIQRRPEPLAESDPHRGGRRRRPGPGARAPHSWYHFLSLYLSMSWCADEENSAAWLCMRSVRSSSCDSLSPRSSTSWCARDTSAAADPARAPSASSAGAPPPGMCFATVRRGLPLLSPTATGHDRVTQRHIAG